MIIKAKRDILYHRHHLENFDSKSHSYCIRGVRVCYTFCSINFDSLLGSYFFVLYLEYMDSSLWASHLTSMKHSEQYTRIWIDLLLYDYSQKGYEVDWLYNVFLIGSLLVSILAFPIMLLVMNLLHMPKIYGLIAGWFLFYNFFWNIWCSLYNFGVI